MRDVLPCVYCHFQLSPLSLRNEKDGLEPAEMLHEGRSGASAEHHPR